MISCCPIFMKRAARNALLLFALATCVSAGTQVVPVMSGPIGDRVYRTTLELRASAADQCTFELHARNGKKFEAMQQLEPARPLVLPDFGSAFQVSSAARVSCANDVEVLSRIQESTDGGTTYSRGILFSTPAHQPLIHGETAVVPVQGAVNIAEISGQVAHLKVSFYSARLKRISMREYELVAHEQQLIEFSDALGSLEATIEVSGPGSVVLSTQATAPQPRSPIRDIVASPFKAAPFTDAGTGLVYFRNRWYDPGTGTWLSPDPVGNQDSSNLYLFSSGDPVNGSDPLGLRSDAKDLPRNFQVPKVRERRNDAAAARSEAMIQCGANALTDRARGAAIGSVPGVLEVSTGARMAQHAEHIIDAARNEGTADALGAAWNAYTDELQSLPFLRWGRQAVAASNADVSGDACTEAYHRTGLAVDVASDTALAIGVAQTLRAPNGFTPRPSSATKTPHAKGRLGVEWSRESALSRGAQIVGEEIDLVFRISGKNIRVRADVLTFEGVDYIYIESKYSANASYTRNQSIVIPELVKAGDAGLVAEVGPRSGTLNPGDKIRVVFQGDVWTGGPRLYGQ
jgi:RHS repeat-associated protein